MKNFSLFLFAFALVVSLIGCSTSATPSATPLPTPDAKATETKIAANIFATQTASVPTATNTPLPTDTPPPTNTPRPTDTPLPTSTLTLTPTPRPTVRPTAVPTVAAVPKNSPFTLGNKWQVTYVGEFRDKTLFFFDTGLTAFGVYVTIEFRIKNLQSGTDSIDRSYTFVAVDSAGNIYEEKFSASQNARWEYCGCSVDVNDVDPGQETVIVITFDVPENTKRLTVYPRFGYFGNIDFEAHWVIENVDQIPAFKHK